MTDIATLGLEVDSKPVEKANDNLKDFTKQATAAERAAERWGKTTSGAAAQVEKETTLAAKAVSGLGTALKVAFGVGAASLVAFTGAITLANFIEHTDAAKEAMKSLGKTWDGLFAVGPAATQPLTHAIEGLAKALQHPVFAGFVHTIGEILFALRKLAIEGLTLLVNGFTFLLENLETFKVAAAAAGGVLLVAFGPAIFASIVAGFSAMASAGMAAISMITAAIAANPFGALAVGIVAAITALYVFRDEVQKAIGVDVIGIVKYAANYIIGSFVAAYNDIKFLWANFPDIMGAAVIGAVNAVARGITAILQASAKGIDWLIDKANKIPGVNIEKIGDIGPAKEQANPYADRLAKAAQSRGAQQQEELNRDYLGALGGMIKLSAPGPGLHEAAKGAKAAREEIDRAAEAYQRILIYGQNFIDMQKAELAGIGLSAEAAARLRYEQELLNRARKAGIDLTPQQTATLKELAGQMAQAEEAVRRAKELYDLGRTSFSGFFRELNQGLRDGKGLAQSFGDAFLNMLNRISDKLLDMATQRLFDEAFGGSGGGGGLFGGAGLAGLFGGPSNGIGGLFGGASFGGSTFADLLAAGMIPVAKGGVFQSGSITPFARGGVVDRPTLFPMARGTGLMGEAGPEAVMPLRRGRNGRLGVEAGGGRQQPVVVYVTGDTDLVRVAAEGAAVSVVQQAAPGIESRAVKRATKLAPAAVATNQRNRSPDHRLHAE